ncbi:MAG TPA: hypothetical protein VFS17_03985 [Methylophilaceae bacterium]|nr:hypothetical protein [Methylophilaceae bacterium]
MNSTSDSPTDNSDTDSGQDAPGSSASQGASKRRRRIRDGGLSSNQDSTPEDPKKWRDRYKNL